MASLQKNMIYGIIDPRSGAVCYVGKTIIGKERWRIHCNSLGRNEHFNPRLQYLFNLIKETQKLQFFIIETGLAEEFIDVREVYWIEKYRAEGIDLFNMTDGGDGRLHYRHKEESKLKISAAKKGKKYKPMRPEVKKNMARKLSEEARRNIGEASRKRKGIKSGKICPWKGQSLSEEWRAKLRLHKRAHGEKQHLARLTTEKVLEIRQRLENNYYGLQAELAKKYGVRIGTINSIKQNKTWKHLIGNSNG